MISTLRRKKREPLADFKDALVKSFNDHELDVGTVSLIEGSMHLRDMRVQDIMIPRAQMVTLNIDDSLDEIMKTVISASHSRYPVFVSQGSSVQGVLLAKDLLSYFQQGSAPFSLRDQLRPAFHTPLSRRLNELLNDFRRNHSHLALAIDEHVYALG